MQAYEFNTVVQNGVIHIPKQFQDRHLSSVRVILLSNTVSHFPEKNIKRFSAMRFKTNGFKFNREEANER